tara:strand:- start:4312 stop:4566 length:255 start_codon:yes stop_codon:yes gene_type:complete
MANWEDEMEAMMNESKISSKKTFPNSKPQKMTKKQIADRNWAKQERARTQQMGQDSASRMVEQIQKEEALKKAQQRSGVSKPYK